VVKEAITFAGSLSKINESRGPNKDIIILSPSSLHPAEPMSDISEELSREIYETTSPQRIS
jgi:hypothetical protein